MCNCGVEVLCYGYAAFVRCRQAGYKLEAVSTCAYVCYLKCLLPALLLCEVGVRVHVEGHAHNT